MSNVRLTQTAAKELLIAHLRALVKECRLFHELQGHDDVIPRGECDPICDAMKAAEKALRAYDTNAAIERKDADLIRYAAAGECAHD